MNPDIFRRYDIRGVVDVDLTETVVSDIGRALGTSAWRAGARTFGVGRDCRLHSPRLRDALVEGLRSTGLDVIDLGVVPTPLLYFATLTRGLGGGVQITGSHNPPEYNGFKMMIGEATIHGEAIAELRRIIEDGDALQQDPGALQHLDVLGDYVDHVAADVHVGRPLKVALDAGNGVGAIAALPLLEALGVEVVGLYTEPDGAFPHHHPDPSDLDNLEDLAAAVRRTGADLGVAYDGDADRLGVIDDQGEVVYADHLLALLARDLLEQAPGALVIGDVKCSQTVFDDIEAHGGQAMMWRVGHSLIKARMKETGALLAGEMSGHLFYAHRYLGVDDAVYATARLLELLGRSPEPLSARLSTLTRLCGTPEIRLPVPDADKFDLAERVAARFAAERDVVTLDGARVTFEEGWGLVRASNTQPALTLRAEGTTPEARDAILTLLKQAIEEAARGDDLTGPLPGSR